ncbi:protein ECT2 [Neocloeon triangulifer]|uniref:protein ECT2 n=1 Tax=Neocloeon triangulifer TaxID=2078957 RepID=UPI00286F81F3|nr:protein ECT2 [Neocloeon triangulifer]
MEDAQGENRPLKPVNGYAPDCPPSNNPDIKTAKICIIRDNEVRDDPVHEAAKKYCDLVKFSRDGSELLDLETVYIVDDFEGPVFNSLRNRKCRILGPTALIQYAQNDEPLPTRYTKYPTYCLHMRGATVCFSWFRDRIEMDRMAKEVYRMGGSLQRDMSKLTTHLIAARCSGEKYQYANTFRVPIVSVDWLHDIYEQRNDPKALNATDPLVVQQYKLKPFTGARICFFGFPDEEKKHMEAVLIENCGTLVDIDDSSCTHVVVEEGTVPDINELQGHCNVVKAEWFWLSVQKESCVDEAEYILEQAQHIGSNGDHTPLSSTPLSHSYTSSARRKRKRLGFHARQSGASITSELLDATYSPTTRLSLSASILDSTASPEPGASVPDTANLVASPAPLAAPLSPRQMVFLELVQTETNYVEILHTIVNLFKEPLESKEGESAGLLNATELKIIFGNLPPIYEVHKEMLADLQEAALNWRDDTTRVGAIVLKCKDAILKAYPPFINFFEDTKKMLVSCDESNPRFHAFLKIRYSRPECGRQSLNELLIRPVQRLPSMSLLLNDLAKQTPKSNPDHELLLCALAEVKRVMNLINEDKRKTEGQVALFDIFNEIENCPADIVASHRTFVQRCDVNEISNELSGRGEHLTLILFSDMLEICKRKTKTFSSLRSPSVTSLHSGKFAHFKPYKHIMQLPLSTIKRVIDYKETEGTRNVFALRCRSNQEFKEREYLFAWTNEEVNKTNFLKTLCRQLANTVCRTDADSFLAMLDPAQLDIEFADAGSMGTLSKAFKFASKTRKKVGRAFSFNRTPSKLKRAVSTVMSPFGSSLGNATPCSQLEHMRLASCTSLASVTSLAELGSPRPIAEALEPPMSVQPVRKNKNPGGLSRF